MEGAWVDLSRFAKPRREIVPMRNSTFRCCGKKYRLKEPAPDGWHMVEIINNDAGVVEQDTLPPECASAAGFTFNNSFIFQNFDEARRKWGFKIQRFLRFNTLETFSAARAAVWEDGELYLLEPNYADCGLFEVKERFDDDEPLDGLKGVTPELRTAYLFHSLERGRQKALLAEKLAGEERERRMRETPLRLQNALERAGAWLEGYSVSGERIVFDWTMEGSPHRYNSVINKNTWMVEEAGYCMSSDDSRHNVTSLVKTAEEYERQGLTYITRR
jgi:hypothetical protein